MRDVCAPTAIRTRDNDDNVAVSALARDLVSGLGVDPADGSTVLDLAAVGVTKLAWRNGPLEDWHADRDRKISNADMLRGNVATTRVVRQAVETLPLAPIVAADPFARVGQALTAPDRILPDGRTVADLAVTASDLQQFHEHVHTGVDRWSALASRHGLAAALWMLASVSGYEREHWWLSPWWPGVVDEFVRDLDRRKPWLDPNFVRNAPPSEASLGPPRWVVTFALTSAAGRVAGDGPSLPSGARGCAANDR
ncbi:MAG: hypothetical protein ACRDQ7_18445, partial [Haloechinothrix sp.]